MNRLSLFAFLIGAAVILYGGLFYYPKYQKQHTEATIGWDVSGYYAYLPATFIYHDLEKAAFLDSIIEKYHPTPNKMQGFQHRSGNYIFKYSLGQSLQFLPWFAIGHAVAQPLGYPADGFSKPYQVAISWGSLLIALIGLWFARLNLLRYFTDFATAITLLLLVLGTNYLNYAAIDNAMTHNWLFTCLSLLIYCTIRFYKKPSYLWAAAVGILLGWAALTRPTELVAAILPILWGVGNWTALKGRIAFIRQHFAKYLLAGLLMGAVGFLQLAYWKFAGKEWLIYSYEDQGFNWLHPHIGNVLLSYRAGWFIYTPMMLFAVAGLYFLYKQRPALTPGIVIFLLLTVYVVSAWNIWWYGGGLGMRAIVQSYAVWIFPLAALVEWSLLKRMRRLLLALAAVILIYLNLWWTHQAHRGKGAFASEQMTEGFYWKVLGKTTWDNNWLKLLDTKDYFGDKERQNVQLLLTHNFESDTVAVTAEQPIEGSKSLLLNKEQQFSPEYLLPVDPRPVGWLRASCTFNSSPKEWDWWRMAQFIVRFSNNGQTVKEGMIRLQRHVDGSESKQLYIDVRTPKTPYDKIVVFFWNADSDKAVRIDDLKVEVFQ